MTARAAIPALLVASLATLGCHSRDPLGQPSSTESSILPPQGRRDKVTVSDLLAGRHPAVVHNGYFMPVGDSGIASHSFSGILRFSETALITTRPDSDWSGTGQRFFPSFELAVVRHGDVLLPLERGIIYSGGRQRSFWNVIASPGRVWQEADDNGWSRASFPFVLSDNFVGQALNGLATFLFTSTEISPVAVQITQETSPKEDYTRADFCGAIPAQFAPQELPDAAHARLAYEREIARRPRIGSWSELPDAESLRSTFNGGLPPFEISMAALFMGDILYVQPAETRAGAYPYPLEMRQGAYSVTKTLAMSLSLFYLSERYHQNTFGALITDHVPALVDHPGWRGVTFEHALDMATGTAGNDENLRFIRARSAADKLAEVFAMPDAPYAPGERFNYSSSNTFTLSCALMHYVRAREGDDADYWQLVREQVLEPLGIEHMPVVRTIETDGTAGTPVMGWGCYPTVIETALIGRLLSNEGWIEGHRLLDQAKIREALERTPRRGLPTGSPFSRYIHSFWIRDVFLPSGTITAPYMSGRGGNLVVVLPQGTVAIRYADEDVYDIEPMVAVAESLRQTTRRAH